MHILKSKFNVITEHKFAWLFLLIFSVLLHLTTLNLLPVLDRDEARFAQATKQMFETGDFLQIKFQDEYRNKKPIGIHWLQSIFVSAFGVSKNILDQDNPFIDSIWIYRLTSGVAGCLSVLLIYFLGRSLVGQRAAFIAASLLNISILFVAESHVAKTDSCLLVSIIITMLTLGKFYLKVSNNKWDFLFLWLGLSATILIKGPIGLIIFLTTIFTLSIWDKDFKWIMSLKPILGLIILAIITCPWFIYITLFGSDNFLRESISEDLLSKVFSVQESHGGFPGYYTLSMWMMLWPGSMFILPAILNAWNNKTDKLVKFLFSWLIPNWILFEIIPTKLFHYTLPMYPTLTLLIGYALKDKLKLEIFKSNYAKIGCLISLLVGVIISLLLLLGNYLFGSSISYIVILFSALILFSSIFVAYMFLKNKIYLALFFNLALGFVSSICIIFSLGWGMDKFWVTQKVANIINGYSNVKGIGVAGYHEPSLVFDIGTNINLVSLDSMIDLTLNKKINTVIIEDRKLEKFDMLIKFHDINVDKIGRVEGFNAAKGINVGLNIFIVNKKL